MLFHLTHTLKSMGSKSAEIATSSRKTKSPCGISRLHRMHKSYRDTINVNQGIVTLGPSFLSLYRETIARGNSLGISVPRLTVVAITARESIEVLPQGSFRGRSYYAKAAKGTGNVEFTVT